MRAADFAMDVRDEGQDIEIVLRGYLDESVELIAPRTDGRPVTVDCGEVRRLNSRGAAIWCDFLRQLTQQGPVVLRRLSPIMVKAASMITTFIGAAQVESFLSHWDCLSCKSDRQLLHKLSDPVPYEVVCTKCKARMELGADRASYLAFREL